MLPDYGVVIGQYVNYTTNQGQWKHVDLNIQAAELQYQAAVDVNEPNGLFQFSSLQQSRRGPFRPYLGTAGWLAPSGLQSRSDAMDYARSLILQRPLSMCCGTTLRCLRASGVSLLSGNRRRARVLPGFGRSRGRWYGSNETGQWPFAWGL
jgi:hypothetical protein